MMKITENGRDMICGLGWDEARATLLELYNRRYEDYAPSWDVAVLNSVRRGAGAMPTRADGTRYFDEYQIAYE